MAEKTAAMPLTCAKITVRMAIDDVIRSVESGWWSMAHEDRWKLVGTLRALEPIFGQSIYDRVFAATNHFGPAEYDLDELRAVLEWLEDKYPDDALYEH